MSGNKSSSEMADRIFPSKSFLCLSDDDKIATCLELRKAVKDCRERGLYQAAKWAGELLLSLPPAIRRQATQAAGPSSSKTAFPNHHDSSRGENGKKRGKWLASDLPAFSTPPHYPGHTSNVDSLQSALDDLPRPPPFVRGSRSHSTKRPRSSLGDIWTPDDPEHASSLMGADLEASMDMEMDLDASVGAFTAGSSMRSTMSQNTAAAITSAMALRRDQSSSESPILHSTPILKRPGLSRRETIEEEERMLEIEEEDVFLLAKSYFDAKEMDRCRNSLRVCRSKKAVFLRIYATYLTADKKAQELLPHFLDSKAEVGAIAPFIYPLLEQLENETEPYLVYLKGVLHFRLGQRDLALLHFIESASQATYNWSCWLSIANCMQSAEQYTQVKQLLPQGIMLAFFAINVMLDLHSATDVMMTTIDELQKSFPTSIHLMACKGMVYYHMRDFDEAEKTFDEVRAIDPYRLEELEIYSNMLYVMNKKAKLGQIAHEYAEIDENRAEVCCLIGNYFSSRDEHVKAIQYFKRSLQLNRDYLPAWTLLGHEFVELKNSHAAIEAYRRAIDVNPKDYRAWYGLGQTYELLDMQFYAIQYYNRATALRPFDCRMWSALAGVYEKLKRIPEAIQCNTRALLGADAQQTLQILAKLGQLYDSLGQYSRACDAHQRYAVLAEREERDAGEIAQAYLYIAQYEIGLLHRDRGVPPNHEEVVPNPGAMEEDSIMSVEKPSKDVKLVIQLLEKVIASNAPEKEAAEEDLRYIRKKYGVV